MESSKVPRKVRSWYGLSGEIIIEHDYWHLVKVAFLPLPHPPLVNLFIRRGLPLAERRRLSYWHEFGHLQTLTMSLVHAFWLLNRRPPRLQSWRTRFLRLGAIFFAHEATWELMSEAYVILKTGRDYRRLYRTHPNPRLVFFWAGMTGLALAASWIAGGAEPVLSICREERDNE